MVSIWERESYYPPTDVLIVGGGLMGLWTAYELLKASPNLKVAICEALPVPALASTRNAGFACFGSPGELWADQQAMGDRMWDIVEMRYRGIQKILQVLGASNIGFERLGGFELFGQSVEWNGSGLREKLEILNNGFLRITGVKQVYSDQTQTMGTLGIRGFRAMAGNSIEGGLHSGRMVFALQGLVQQAGAIYLTGHEALSTSRHGNGLAVALRTRQAETVEMHTRAVIWATNASLASLQAEIPKVHPARGQVLVSPPVEGLRLRGTFHFKEGFYYFRNLGNRLLIGGARNRALAQEETLLDRPTPEIRGYLEEFIRCHLPQVEPVLGQKGWQHWAGIMGMTGDKLPFVKATGEYEWAVLACNGMGVALTPMVAGEVAWMVGSTLQ